MLRFSSNMTIAFSYVEFHPSVISLILRYFLVPLSIFNLIRSDGIKPLSFKSLLSYLKSKAIFSKTLPHFQFSTILTFISTLSRGLSLLSLGTFTILSTASIPDTTSPKTVYWLSRNGASATQMKN